MSQVQHLAIRVSDVERSTRFYVEALGGKVVARPYVNGTEWTEFLFGVPGLEYVIGYVELPDGFGLELFQFRPASAEPIGRPQPFGGFMHFAVAVDDVAATLARGAAAGGKAGEIGGFGDDPARYAYLEDPDGNVIELNNTTWEKVLASAVEIHPEAAL